MKCDNCKEEYRGSKGWTIKDMNKNKIKYHFCDWPCLFIFVKYEKWY